MTTSKMALQAALKAYDADDYAQAAALFRPLAEQGVVEARFRLALMSHQGHVRPKNYLEAYDWYVASRDKAPAEIAESLRVWIGRVFRRAIPRNARTFVFVQLLETAWRDDPALKAQMVRRLIRLARDPEDPPLPVDPAWMAEAAGKALAPLRELAWDAESQRQDHEWRTSLIGKSRRSPTVAGGGFITGIREVVVGRIAEIVRFSVRFDEDYRHKLAVISPAFSAAEIQALGSAWIAVSTQFIADADRPYRGESALGELEPAMLSGSMRTLQLSPMPRTAEEARVEYVKAYELDTPDEFLYWLLGNYYGLIKSAESLVRRRVIAKCDLRLLIRLGPQDQATDPNQTRAAQHDDD